MVDWQQSTLGRVLTKANEWTEIAPNTLYKQVTVKLWGKGVVLRREVQGSQIAAKRQRVVSPGQFILSRIDARNGAFGLVPEELAGAIVSNDFPSFRIDADKLMPEYLAWLSKTSEFVELCQLASEGTTNRVRLQEDRFLQLTIPLPPLDEQRRIVACVDALAARIAEAQALRSQALAEAEAVMGAAADRLFSGGNWPTASVDEIVGRKNLRNGKSAKPTSGISDIRCLRLSALRNGRIDCTDAKSVPIHRDDAEPYFVKPGDVYVVRGNGSLDLVGRAGIIDNIVDDLIFPDLFIKVPLQDTPLMPEFFVRWWNSAHMRSKIKAAAKTTSGIWKINQGHISSFMVPLPSVTEQRRIVAHLDVLQAKVDAVKDLQAATQAELNALLPAVLDRAFKGEL
ncbi:MAG: restriction endonuclease subunit S [Caldilineaceae bacterium]|nr:restriction endonuclease subunit S [Caldilineaceae bacterium]